MEPAVFLTALLIFFGIPAFTVITVTRMRAKRADALPSDTAERLETLERTVQDVQQQLAETHERLDFTERLLGKARDERK